VVGIESRRRFLIGTISVTVSGEHHHSASYCASERRLPKSTSNLKVPARRTTPYPFFSLPVISLLHRCQLSEEAQAQPMYVLAAPVSSAKTDKKTQQAGKIQRQAVVTKPRIAQVRHRRLAVNAKHGMNATPKCY